MRRQRYQWDPALKAYAHTYVDAGPMSASIGQSRPVVQTFVPGGTAVANVNANGGAKVKRLRGQS